MASSAAATSSRLAVMVRRLAARQQHQHQQPQPQRLFQQQQQQAHQILQLQPQQPCSSLLPARLRASQPLRAQALCGRRHMLPFTARSGAAASSSGAARLAAAAGFSTTSMPRLGAAAAAAAGQGRRVALGSSAAWRAWVAHQLGSQAGSRAAAAGSRRMSATAAAAAAAPGSGAAASWWDTWVLWVDRSSSLLMTSLLNSLNLAGNKLPVALGLLLCDMAHNSPLLGGARADAWEPPVLPDKLPAGGFYADGGPAAAAMGAAAAAAPAMGVLAAAWAEAAAALSASARLLWLGCIWLPALLSAPLLLNWDATARAAWLALMTLSLEVSGPAFIKWGQWAATRHDLFAHDVCAALEKLHTQAPTHSFRYTCLALQRSFALPVSELFEWIEEAPIACGSIGQVHRASLSAKGAALTGCDAGETVAVKVRHPGVSDAIERDFQTMVWLAHVATTMVPSLRALRLDETLKQFAAPLHEQVDLSREAANLQRFNTNFRRARGVSFPLPLYPLVSPDVLVESFESGTHISDYISAKEGSHPYRVRLAELGSGAMLQMMLVDNLIHSDLHPGNILVRLDQPHGLVGVAYRAVTALANPRGLPMRALGSALDLLSPDAVEQQQQQQQQQQQGGRRAVSVAAGSLAAREAKPQAAAAATPGSSSSSRGRAWLAQLRSAWSEGGSNALLSQLQAQLSDVAASWLQPHIVLLDVGMATELSPEDQHNMVGLFRAFAALDGRSVARWTLRFSGPDQACPDPQAFIDDMEVTFEALKKTIAAHQAEQARWQAQQQQQWRATATSSSSSTGAALSSSADGSSGSSSASGPLVEMPEQFDSGAEALSTVLELVRAHGVSLSAPVAGCVVTTLILEGWSNRLAPEHSVLHQVQEMFGPSLLPWGDRITTVVDVVMDRNDTALAMT